jgi:serine/threonine protein kinase/WD40 repeat protein/tetratricopeptide (TPR) repeat protein
MAALTIACPKCGHGVRLGEPTENTAVCPACGSALDRQGAVVVVQPVSDGKAPTDPSVTPAQSNSAVELARTTPSPQEPGATLQMLIQPTTLALPAVAGYEIVGQLGHGGMGVVYKARQTALKRFVALKMILAGPHAAPALIERFRTEAEAVARFQHPNIVQIYEVGAHQGLPFCALEFVDGGNLGQRIATGPLEGDEAARIAEPLARAIHYAHQHKVIHRDLKPANVLLTADGEPKVTDFGLAKQLDTDSGITQSGQVLGTPSYMAPEQAYGRHDQVGPLTDVYSLGAILYEMLTGRPPFRGETMMATLEQVCLQDPVPPSKLQPKVPRDLETICLKCLAKNAGSRYRSALALAQDLERFRAGEPILARPESSLARLWRKARRSRTAILSSVALVLSIVIAILVARSLHQERRLGNLHQRLQAELNQEQWTAEHADAIEATLAELALVAPQQVEGYRTAFREQYRKTLLNTLSKPRLEAEDIRFVKTALEDFERRFPDAAQDLREQLRQRQGEWTQLFRLEMPFRGWNELFPNTRVKVNGDELTALPAAANAVANPDVMTTVPCIGNAEMEAVFAAPAAAAPQLGILLHTTEGFSGWVRALAFSQDGRLLATGSSDGTVRLWEVPRGREIHVFKPKMPVNGVAITPDRKVLAASGKNIQVWEIATGRLVQEVSAHPAGISSLALAPDGQRVVSGGADGKIKLWDPATWNDPTELTGHTASVNWLAFERDGRALASASNDKTAQVWNLERREATVTVSHAEPVSWVALSADGRKLASATNHETRLWEVKSGKETPRLDLRHGSPLAFAPDGQTLVTGNVTINLAKPATRDFLANQFMVTSAACFTPDGQQIVTAHRDGTVRFWDATTRKPRSVYGRQSYEFLVSATSARLGAPTSDKQALTLADRQKAGEPVFLQIRRNGACLREEAVRLPTGSLKLKARREGERLQLQLEPYPALVFLDNFALSSEAGYYGLYWPAGVPVERVQAWRQLLTAHSRLEQGDQLYAGGQLTEALAAYEQQVKETNVAAASQEARFKTAVCLLGLGRPEEAGTILERLAGESGDRWPPAAACRLWLLRLQQGRFDDADLVFTSLSTRFRLEDLISLFPDEDRRAIMSYYHHMWDGAQLLYSPKMTTRLEFAVKVGDYLNIEPGQRSSMLSTLSRAYQLAGKPDRALEVARTAMKRCEDLPPSQRLHAAGQMIGDYIWLLRLQGQTDEAAREIEKWMYVSPGVETDSAPLLSGLLLERAAIHISKNKRLAAEQDLARCFELLSRQSFGAVHHYYLHVAVYMMHGFLLEDRGDHAGALAAWRKASLQAWAKDRPEDWQNFRDHPTRAAIVVDWACRSLTNDVSDADADKIIAQMMETFGESRQIRQAEMQQYLKAIPFSPAAIRTAWQTPRGRDYARKAAFHQLNMREVVRIPPFLLAAAAMRVDAFGDKMTDAEEALAWKLVEDTYELYATGKISKTKFLQLALTWKGTTNFLGWGSVGPTLPPAMRGPLAYALGHRFLRLERPKDAEMFFRTALNDAPANSPLKSLAQAQLDRLKK